MTTPSVVGFYKTDPLVPQLADTATLAALQVWCRREGYVLGTSFREQNGNGALDAMLTALEREGVVGVIVPSLDHLGPMVEDRVSRISDTGKQLFVAYPTKARR